MISLPKPKTLGGNVRVFEVSKLKLKQKRMISPRIEVESSFHFSISFLNITVAVDQLIKTNPKSALNYNYRIMQEY